MPHGHHSSAPAPDADFVFNVVWTGDAFEYLHHFVRSLMDHCGARFRFVINYCTAESIEQMTDFGRHHDQITEVLDVTSDRMAPHGTALDRVLDIRDDGEYFSFIDADIRASGPFLPDFSRWIIDCDAVTSGAEVWSDTNIAEPDQLGLGLGGRHFYHPDGFVYGSPHMAIYRRSALDDTMKRWSMELGDAGVSLDAHTTSTLDQLGHLYPMYDTGKLVNILFQVDGHRLRHQEHSNLMHIGGMSHYLTPPEFGDLPPDEEPGWTKMPGLENRAAVTRFSARMLCDLRAGRTPAAVPQMEDDGLRDKLLTVRAALIDLVDQYPT